MIQSQKRLQENGRYLSRKHVQLDKDRYCLWWALAHSKGDPFGKRKGKDGLDWTVTSGCKTVKPDGSRRKHPIDIVALYYRYCQLMGFDPNSRSHRSRMQADLPFFQELDSRGRPTGAPLEYNTILYALKADTSDYFPDLDPADYGTHTFRRFGATYAKCKGIPDDLIQYMGRWVSDCFQRYFIFGDDQKVEMSRDLVP